MKKSYIKKQTLTCLYLLFALSTTFGQISKEAPSLKLQRAKRPLAFGVWHLAILLSFELLALNFSAVAAEPWADDRLAVTNQLELWFDASHQGAGRSSLQLSELTAGNSVDYLIDGSGRRRHLVQPAFEQRPRFRQEFTGAFLRFDGTNDCLEASLLNSA